MLSTFSIRSRIETLGTIIAQDQPAPYPPAVRISLQIFYKLIRCLASRPFPILSPTPLLSEGLVIARLLGTIDRHIGERIITNAETLSSLAVVLFRENGSTYIC